MPVFDTTLSTGLPGLDRVLRGLMPGDNIVFQVGDVRDYAAFVKPYCATAVAQGRKLVYFRFARHDPLLEPAEGIEIRVLDPEAGFETFLDEIHRSIEEAGRGAYYVFDCLSDLAVDWYSDRMVGNFFMLTCPYLYDLETITYFAILRDYHSVHATDPIAETTQLLLDVYRHKGVYYLYPLKVLHRYSGTMHMLHAWEGDTFKPVSESYIISEVLHAASTLPTDWTRSLIGVWQKTFALAADALKGGFPAEETEALFKRLLRMAVSRDRRVLDLAERYLTLHDVVEIGNRMIGTGLIGGKAAGMLIARAILKRSDPRWLERLEEHDSFYIGSDVFYTFLVRNGCWWVRQKQRNPASFLDGAEMGRQRILTGTFPDYIERQFEEMLDYFGQSPIIVRSSSLLEDNFGNAFAGKYDSVFCANQGSRHKRLADFISAVRTIYASTMSEKALSYRARRGMLDRDEQMALLVQRVSGSSHGSFYFPHVAGVGFSFNPYVWNEYIEPEAGLLRLVFGLGTRAVDRADDDYTRVVALNAPDRRPESSFDKIRQYAQRRVDVLDLEANLLISTDFPTVVQQDPAIPLRLFASRDEQVERQARERGQKNVFSWFLTFDELLANNSFVDDIRCMLATLSDAYHYPVDTEFTANFPSGGDYRINLVQCRPLQVKSSLPIVEPPATIAGEDLLLATSGPVIGQSRIDSIDRIICVVPEMYGRLPISERYRIARLIGQLTHIGGPDKANNILLLGPGRWGTTTPSLGVPVSFAEINTISFLCEIVAMREDLVPDVSLGTHFFSELVEMDMLYLALFPNHEGNVFNLELIKAAPNKLVEYLPQAAAYTEIVKIVNPADIRRDPLRINANTLKQRVLCYFDRQS
ncbi:MAG TPA: PEP/pyruvate-binding domain-containing protein [Candidatus Hydrogenedentes bacterium]|nr:PEP/pyruvate-binding domain-containing protein [Candidatus Hydrogenedentota bacterium]